MNWVAATLLRACYMYAPTQHRSDRPRSRQDEQVGQQLIAVWGGAGGLPPLAAAARTAIALLGSHRATPCHACSHMYMYLGTGAGVSTMRSISRP